MSVYAIFEVDVLDPEAYKPYSANVSALVTKAGGKYLARGGELTTLEGEPGGKRVVILEFPSEAAFRSWYDSEEYKPYHHLRQRVARSRALLIQGIQAGP